MGSGQADVKRYNRYLRDLIHDDRAAPSFLVSHELPLDEAPDAYKHFDARDKGWTKVILHPGVTERAEGAGAAAGGGERQPAGAEERAKGYVQGLIIRGRRVTSGRSVTPSEARGLRRLAWAPRAHRLSPRRQPLESRVPLERRLPRPDYTCESRTQPSATSMRLSVRSGSTRYMEGQHPRTS